MPSSMICRISTALCFLLGVASAGATAHIDPTTRNHSVSRQTVVVAVGGVAKLPVIVAVSNSETRAAADELALYLGKITGATFEVRPGGTGPGIYVGTIADFPTRSAEKGLRISETYDGKEAFAIRTEDGSVKLLGAASLGVSHAVYRFLEINGCRWFFQGPTWEVVPQISNLTFNINETDRPEVWSRYFGYPRGEQFEKGDPDAGQAFRDWWRRNRVAESFKTSAGHSSHEIAARFAEEFDAHPEYWALQADGKRRPNYAPNRYGQHCITNPRVIELAIQRARELLDKYPQSDMVSVGPDDCAGWCTCAECAKLGNPGNQAFYLANQVAKAVQQSHPGKFVGLLAYSWHCDPPDFPLEPNVYVELTTALLLNTKYGFDQLLELWPQKCRFLGLYDYWAVYDWIRDRLPSGRTGDSSYVAKKLPFYIKHGISRLSAESGNSWGSQGLGYYLASRVLWNSATDTEALKKDFYEQAFGPAAGAMKGYYERVDLASRPLVGPSFYRLCLDDLENAEKAAAGRPDVLARIRQLRQYHVFVYLNNRLAAAAGEAASKARETAVDASMVRSSDATNAPLPAPADSAERKSALDLMRWNYLIRNSYMTFWSFFTTQTTVQLADKLGEPSWNWYHMWQQGRQDDIPYRDTKVSAAALVQETDVWFEKMKAAYGEVTQVAEVRFSDRFVLPEWNDTGSKPGTRGYPLHQGYLWHGDLVRVMLVSRSGEPLRFTINQGTIYKQLPDGEYVVTTPTGAELVRGKLALGEHKLEIKVPAAGVYCLKYNDNIGGGMFLPDERLQGAFVLERGAPFKVDNYVSAFFYVPKGTRSICLYANKGGDKFGIRQPDGKWVGEDKGLKPENSHCYLKADGSYLNIPVPDGMDGKVWSALLLNNGSFYFFNIPNVLSFASDGVLVPEEVAEKDGLSLLRPQQ